MSDYKRYELTPAEKSDLGQFITKCFDLNDPAQKYQSTWAEYGFEMAMDYIHNVVCMKPLSEFNLLKSENERLKAALRFYANENNYRAARPGDYSNYKDIGLNWTHDSGSKARIALKECGE